MHKLTNRIIYFLFFLSSLIKAEVFHIPDNRQYESSDRGYEQYAADSIHGKGIYSLTFDDGPHEVHTPIILDILKKYNVRASFFIITERVNNKTMPIIERVVNEGHLLASHGISHANSNTLSSVKFKNNLKNSLLIIEEINSKLGVNTIGPYYRFPYAAYGRSKNYHHMNIIQEVSNEIYNQNLIHFAFWDIDSADWVSDMSPKDVAGNILAYQIPGTYYTWTEKIINGKKLYIKVATENKITKGGVVLMHDIQAKTVKALPILFEAAKKLNMQFVRLDEIEEYYPLN